MALKGEVMNQLPSEKCGNCIWWYEGPLLCEGCPNNPESEARKMPCSQCKKILSVSDFCEIHYERGRPLLALYQGVQKRVGGTLDHG
jgi:hypothetical protein